MQMNDEEKFYFIRGTQLSSYNIVVPPPPSPLRYCKQQLTPFSILLLNQQVSPELFNLFLNYRHQLCRLLTRAAAALVIRDCNLFLWLLFSLDKVALRLQLLRRK